MVECARLESVYTARYRRFESSSLRHKAKTEFGFGFFNKMHARIVPREYNVKSRNGKIAAVRRARRRFAVKER